MIRSIALYPHPFLRQKVKKVSSINGEVRRLIHDMIETMHHAEGIGLAAPQVLANARIFIIQPDLDDDATLRIFINPEVLRLEGVPFLYEEGCLSIPTIRAKVKRPPQVTLRFQDLEGRSCEETFDDLAARIIQHEYDHLNGILFIDRITSLKRRLLRKGLQQVSWGKVRPKYPHVLGMQIAQNAR